MMIARFPHLFRALATAALAAASVLGFAGAGQAQQLAQTIVVGGGGNLASDFQSTVPDTVYFNFDYSNIRPDAQAILDQQAAWLLANPDAVVEIEGHTDAVDTDDYNYGLGQRRADSVRSYLINHGIDPSRVLTTVSYGESRLVVDTEIREQLNRRAITAIVGGIANQCLEPNSFPYAGSGDLTDELWSRVEHAASTYDTVAANWREEDALLMREAHHAKVECGIALGFARGSRGDGIANNRCECFYSTMVQLLN